MRIRPPSVQLPFVAVAVAVVVAVIALVVVVGRSGSGTPHPSNEALRVDAGQARTARAGALALTSAALVTAGDYATCAAQPAGTVACWGDNSHGQLGDGTSRSKLVPAPAFDSGGVRELAAGGSHACAVTAGGVTCWGSNEHGDLGNGSTVDSHRPVTAPGTDGAVSLAVGVAHTCTALRSGSVLCWGAGTSGQLGTGRVTDVTGPTTVGGLSGRALALAAGLAHTCALLAGGSVECWGSNSNGQLGDGTTVDRLAPVRVAGLAGPAQAIVAGDAHTCALLRSGRVECWGWNIEGQVGDGSGSDASTPTPVVGIRNARALAAGGSHTCAVLGGGAVKCWGANIDGQLGDGTTSDSNVPMPVVGLGSGVTAVTAGMNHSCALLVGGAVTCWGSNTYGQLGDGTTTGSSTPVNVLRLGLARDGSGSMTTSVSVVPAGSSGHTIGFAFTAAPGGMHDGTVALRVPFGWSLPTDMRTAAGYTTSTRGKVTLVGRTIDVSGLTMVGGASLTITYGSRVGGGAGAMAASPGTRSWRAREQSSATGSLSPLVHSPAITVLSVDGSGEVAVPAPLVARTAARGLTFVYTAARGGVAGGVLAFAPPAGWPVSAGIVTASSGSVSVSGGQILVRGLGLRQGQTVRVTYRGVPEPTATDAAWTVSEQSSPQGALVPLATIPEITLLAPDGAGTVDTPTRSVVNGSHGNTLVFTYHPESGTVVGGTVALTIPKGWTPPTRKRGVNGYIDVSRGKVTIAGRQVRVAVGDLRKDPALTITYENGTAPVGPVGSQSWRVQEQSSGSGKLRDLASPPAVTVLAPDGSGVLRRASGPVKAATGGNTVVFTYTAANGGMSDGTITLDVPPGWSAPSLRGSDAGYVTASAGAVQVTGSTVTISGVTLASGQTLTFVYGSRAGGGAGASAPAGHVGPSLWPAAESSSSSGRLTPLRR